MDTSITNAGVANLAMERVVRILLVASFHRTGISFTLIMGHLAHLQTNCYISMITVKTYNFSML